MNRDFVQTLVGVAVILAFLQGCASLAQWADQCGDAKWRGYEHARRCSAYLADRR